MATKEELTGGQPGFPAISYRLAYMGRDEVPNPCGPYFESVTAAQQAAPELNSTRAMRGQRPLDCIVRFRYREHPGRYGQKRKVLTMSAPS
jgi:hypothetical protein